MGGTCRVFSLRNLSCTSLIPAQVHYALHLFSEQRYVSSEAKATKHVIKYLNSTQPHIIPSLLGTATGGGLCPVALAGLSPDLGGSPPAAAAARKDGFDFTLALVNVRAGTADIGTGEARYVRLLFDTGVMGIGLSAFPMEMERVGM